MKYVKTLPMTDRKKSDAPSRKGPARTKSMTAAEFSALEPLLNISPERVKAARLCLVDGLSYEASAKAIGLGWSRQAAADCVRVTWKEWEKYQKSRAISATNKDVPPGWEQVTLMAPSELLPQFYALIAAASAGKPTASAVAKTPSTRKKTTSSPRAKKEA